MGGWSVLLPFLAAKTLLWGPSVGGKTSLVVGVQVEGREVGVVEALSAEQGVCLSVEDFALLSGSRWEEGRRALTTPLGDLVFTLEELLLVEGKSYLCPQVAKARLGTVFSFDPYSVTLTLDFPWGLTRPAAERELLVPDFRPPGWGLGRLRADAWLVREGESETYVGSITLAGRAARGEWRLLMDRPNQEDTAVREFLWQRRWERANLSLGRSWVQLSPLLSGFDLLGTQLAWSNELFPARTGNGFAPWTGALRTFRGPAPPGSLVKLKLDGMVVASQLVGLSGRYEFLDLPISGRGTVVVEVEIYDRHNLLVPQEVRREVVAGFWQILPPGRLIHMAGVGWGGFFGRDLFGEGEGRQSAFFYGLRRGLASRATGEVLFQALGDGWQAAVGLSATPAPWWFLALEAAKAKSGSAWLVESQAVSRDFEATFRAFSQTSGFGFGVWGQHRTDRSLEIRRFFSPWLEVGAWARDFRTGEQRFRWLRPTLGISLRQWLFLRVVPDQQGDLWATVLSSPHPRLRLAASLAKTQVYDATYDVKERRWQLRGTWETGGGPPPRVTATIGRMGERWWSPTLRVGASHSGGRTAPYLEASFRIGGLWFRGEYQGLPRRARSGEPVNSRLYLSLTADFAYASGFLSLSSGVFTQQHQGAVAGRLILLAGEGKRSLAGARIVVVGVGGTVTDAAGRFYVGSVPPGVYEVILDPEKLPLELSPKRSRAVVEVQAGLTTRVDFPLEELFGFAGQIRTDDGNPIPGATVVLVGAEGSQISRTFADAFGLYRFDQLPRGKYQVQVVGAEDQVLAKRDVELREFLFDQDLILGAVRK